MVFPGSTDPRLPHVWHCLSRMQLTSVETLVLEGVIMGTDFEWVRTTLRLSLSLKMLEAAVVIAGDSPRAISRQSLKSGSCRRIMIDLLANLYRKRSKFFASSTKLLMILESSMWLQTGQAK
jgi:hypothetical protein